MNTAQNVVVVTGASRGIGAGIVEGFRRRDYRVVATSRTIAESQDDQVLTVSGDITDHRTAERVVRMALDRFGRIDTLVNNAGIFIAKPFTDYSRADFEAIVAVNLTGFFRITQLAISEMVRRGRGHVVNISAALVDHPRADAPALLAALTKGGLNAATRSLAVEYAARGVRVNAVAPGIVKTSMHPPATDGARAGMHPVVRMAEVADIVEGVLYLESADFVTGEILHVDGGQSAGH